MINASIPADQVARLAGMIEPDDGGMRSGRTILNKGEACEILNLKPDTTAIDHLERPTDHFPTFQLDEVLGLARVAISSGEIAFRCGWPANSGRGLLSRLGVPRLGSALWCRPSVETMLMAGRL